MSERVIFEKCEPEAWGGMTTVTDTGSGTLRIDGIAGSDQPGGATLTRSEVLALRDKLTEWLGDGPPLGLGDGYQVNLPAGCHTAEEWAAAITEQTGGAFEGFVVNGMVHYRDRREQGTVSLDYRAGVFDIEEEENPFEVGHGSRGAAERATWTIFAAGDGREVDITGTSLDLDRVNKDFRAELAVCTTVAEAQAVRDKYMAILDQERERVIGRHEQSFRRTISSFGPSDDGQTAKRPSSEDLPGPPKP